MIRLYHVHHHTVPFVPSQCTICTTTLYHLYHHIVSFVPSHIIICLMILYRMYHHTVPCAPSHLCTISLAAPSRPPFPQSSITYAGFFGPARPLHSQLAPNRHNHVPFTNPSAASISCDSTDLLAETITLFREMQKKRVHILPCPKTYTQEYLARILTSRCKCKDQVC
jgi:hypothetical protein